MDVLESKEWGADVLEQVSQTFKALGDPTRIRILTLLARDECAVNQIADALQLSQSAVSHQLKTLRAYRFVRYRREGQNILYSCDDAHIIGLLNEAVRHALEESQNK
ncbi:ArsR/SmtB family transcription factor [Paenibacillus marinisediminis]